MEFEGIDFGSGFRQEDSGDSSDFVEAIEEGKIVRVKEDYARREGLPILRKFVPVIRKRQEKADEERTLSMDDFRRPLKSKKEGVVKDLIDNFHWKIARERRGIGMSRREFADKLGESLNTVMLLENGILPSQDFVLVNRVEELLDINLRRASGGGFGEMRKLVESQGEEIDEELEKKKNEGVSGRDIQLFDED